MKLLQHVAVDMTTTTIIILIHYVQLSTHIDRVTLSDQQCTDTEGVCYLLLVNESPINCVKFHTTK